MTITEVRQIMDELEIRPKKSLGQNFLVDGNIAKIILREADIQADDTVLEIGPGLGALTEHLLPLANQVIAIEKDHSLCEYLRQKLPNLHLIEDDAIKVLKSNCGGARSVVPNDDNEKGHDRACPSITAEEKNHIGHDGGGHDETCPSITTQEMALTLLTFSKVVANLPYNVASQVLRLLIVRENRPQRMVLTIQSEVADRLVALPGTKEYGALTLFTQLHYEVRLAHTISASCFFPSPKVESAVVVLDYRLPKTSLLSNAPFHDLVRLGFSQRRKMLRKLIAAYDNVDAALARIDAPIHARAEQLTLDQWIRLANLYAKQG